LVQELARALVLELVTELDLEWGQELVQVLD
jgi:hypothetical protein